jgi:hypothetical protein
MARPSQNLSKRITVRLTPDEYARLRRDADTAAVAVVALARSRFLNAPLPKRKSLRSVDHAKLADVLIALGKIGTNLNQIAKVANSTGDASVFRDAKLLKNLLEDVRDQVSAALS